MMMFSPFKTILVFLVLVILGLALVPRLSVSFQPSRRLPSATVSYSWDRASAKVLEQKVTAPLEKMFSRMRGVKKITSNSSTEYGTIRLDFDKNVPLDAMRFELSTIVRQVFPTLPLGVSYPTINTNRVNNEDVIPMMTYTLNAQTAPNLIQQYAEKVLKPQLSSIKGIQNVAIYGANPMEWVLEYDADQLQSRGLSASDLKTAINTYFSKSDAGFGADCREAADTGMIRLVMRNGIPGQIDLMKIPVKRIGDKIVFLNELVSLRRQEQRANSYFRINAANSITIEISAGKQTNQLNLSKQVVEKIKQAESRLPSGYFLLKSSDSTTLIREEMAKNVKRTILTVIILLLLVWMVSKQIRYLLLLVCSLIANLALAVLLYHLFKIELSIYSFAGIALSLGLMLENGIVMTEHYKRYGNRAKFMPMFAATLTTIAAVLSVVVLEESIRVNLMDFSLILSLNLVASLLVGWFLIPALMDVFPLKKSSRRCKSRRSFRWAHRYESLLLFLLRYRTISLVLVVLAFGFPMFLLPNQVESEGFWGKLYNHTWGGDWCQEHVKPIAGKFMGGTLGLFVDDVYTGKPQNGIQQTVLTVNARLPYGSTLEQMNELVMELEKNLLEYPEIKQFKTTISGGRFAYISIYIHKKFERNGFPMRLKQQIVQKANTLAGADWSVEGVGSGFNNGVSEEWGPYKIRLTGYHFDDLYALAEKLKKRLKEHMRVRDVNILTSDSWEKDGYSEFVVDLDREKLMQQQATPEDLYGGLSPYGQEDNSLPRFMFEGEMEAMRLYPVQNKTMDLWQLQRLPNRVGKSMIRMQDVASISKESTSLDVVKENQQYTMILAYDFVGADHVGYAMQDGLVEEIRANLPLGYTVIGRTKYDWGEVSNNQYWLLLLVVVVIFFTCSILLESLLHPLAIIVLIPVSYIGLFLTFYLFNLNFDQGGFAAFILLSGISINSSLYLIYEYNQLRRKYSTRKITPFKWCIKAFNRTIKSILLSELAIVLGLTPFLMGGSEEAFWPALAGGTMGGLTLSVLGSVFLLPLLLLKRKKINQILR